MKLSGLFSFANQDPDSEQRIQYEQRANQDYAKQQADFLTQLAAAQGQEVSSAKQNYQKSKADIATQRNTVQQKIVEMIYQAQKDAADRVKTSGGGSGKVNYKQVGVDGQGQPVFRDFNTGQQWTGTGLKSNASTLTPQMQQDENGNWYYEM